MSSAESTLHAVAEPHAPPKKIRDANIELGRICCFVSIAASHMASLYLYDFSATSKAATFAGACCKMFVTPFFFLTMGAFMSSGTPYQEQLARAARKLAIPFVFTLFLMLQFIPFIKKETGVLGTLTNLHVNLGEYFYSLATVSFNHYEYMGHLWFISGMFMCYLFLPIFRIFLYDSPVDRLYKKNIVLIGAVVFIIFPTIKAFNTDGSARWMPVELPEFPFFWVWLMLLGSYIHGWLRQNKDAVASYVVWLVPPIFLMFGAVNFYLTEMHDLKPDLMVNRFAFLSFRGNITVFLPNLLPFIWFHCISIKDAAWSNAIRYVSDKCFYMYLVHLPIIEFFNRYLNLNDRKPLIGHFLFWLMVVFLSFAIACVLKYFERRAYSLAAKLWSRGRNAMTLPTP